MTLYPTRAYRNAALTWLLAGLFIAYQLFVAVRLALTAHWDFSFAPLLGVGVMAVLPLVAIDFALLIYPLAYLTTGRRQRAAAAGDPAVTPPVAYQPRRELALREGETLTLTRYQRGWTLFITLARVLVVAGMLMGFGEVLTIGLLSGLSSTALNPLNTLDPFSTVKPLSAVSPLDWACAAFPLVTCLALVIPALYSVLRGQHDTLVADDRGVTRLRSWGSVFIPWSDIHIFMRPTNNTSDAPAGGYTIWGQRHGFMFSIATRPASHLIATGRGVSLSGIGFQFEGGYDAYERDARRLLATIAARSYRPLIYWTGTTTALPWLRRRFPLAGLTETTALALPLADAALQPDAATIAAAGAFRSPSFKLAARLRFSWPGLIVESLVYFLFLGGFSYLYGAGSNELMSPAHIASGDPWSLLTLAIIIPLLVFFSVLFAFARRANRAPGVTVSPTGLKGANRAGSRQVVEVAWEDMRAWVMVSGTPNGKRPPLYTVIGADGLSVTWAEPERARLAGRGITGDREAAYRALAAELHGLIAVRAGLALRDGTPRLSERAPTLARV